MNTVVELGDSPTLERFIEEAGLRIEASTNEPRWDGSAPKVGESLDWILLAEHAHDRCRS